MTAGAQGLMACRKMRSVAGCVQSSERTADVAETFLMVRSEDCTHLTLLSRSRPHAAH